MMRWFDMMRWLPENVSTYGADIDFIFYLIYYITAAVFVIVTVLMVAFLVMYRHREGRRATYSHGHTALEIIWTVVPTIILVLLWVLSAPIWAEIKNKVPDTDFKIRVTAKQFNWEVQYPGPDGQFDTEDDKVFDNEIHIPVGKPVILGLRSRDVIHSLFLPEFRFKQDMVPGREIPEWLEATKPGKYEMPCAELCGFGHSGMKGWLYVHPPEEYEEWVKEEWSSS